MFYVPKRVKNWDDQFDKWWHLWIWQWVPGMDLFFILVNFFTWCWDLWFLNFQTPRFKVFPSMYENLIA